MPFFNGTIVTKKLRNIIDTFFRKLLKINIGLTHLDTLIVSQMLDKMQEGTSAIIARCFFSIENSFTIERWEKLGFITFKSKLNEI